MLNQNQQNIVNQLVQEVWNNKKIDALKTLVSSDCQCYYGNTLLQGIEAIQGMINEWQQGFPDLQTTIDETIATDDTVVVRWTKQGTHLGIFQLIPPTNRSIKCSGVSILKINNGKITAAWFVVDLTSILKVIQKVSDKIYTRDYFNADFNGPAKLINELVFLARPVPSCDQILANAIRTGTGYFPPATAPQLVIPPEIIQQVDRSEIFIDTAEGKLRLLVYVPKNTSKKSLPGLVYLHAGGWMAGAADGSELVARKLAYLAEMIIISVDYRLVPEHPFPSALNDAVYAYQWARKEANKTFNIDTQKIAVGGDSSGASIAASMVFRIKDLNLPSPNATLLMMPATDLLNLEKHPSYLQLGTRGLLYDVAFGGYLRSTCAPYEKLTHPYVSPINGDLHNYPPTFMLIAGQDPLHNDNEAFVEKLRAAGNKEVEVLFAENMVHTYHYFLGLCKEEDIAYRAIAKFLQKVLA